MYYYFLIELLYIFELLPTFVLKSFKIKIKL